jgi:hypothetical protein
LSDLQRAQASARLAFAAEYIRQGAAPQVAATDSVTTSALRDLQRSTAEALALANQEAVAGQRQAVDPNAELVAEIQSLRRQLAELTQQQPGQGGQQGQQGQNSQGQNGQQPGQQPGQGQAGGEGQQANAGGAQGGQFGGRDAFGPGGAGGFYDPLRGGVWDPRNGGAWQNPETIEQAREQLTDASRELLTLGNRLRGEGLTDEQLQAVRELGEALRGSLTGNPALVEQEFRALVNLAEQLELKLGGANNSEGSAVRAEAPAQIAQGYEEAVAEYFRRLSRSAAQ